MNQHTRPDARANLKPIPFIDVGAQRKKLGRAIDDAVAKVLNHCQFILGPEVRELEAQLSAFAGVKHTVSCASGTDALMLVLLAKNVGTGDAVFCPSFTFAATCETVALVGATPVFVDVEEDTFNMNVDSLEKAIATAKKLGLKPKAIIPVDLFGLPADHDSVAEIAEEHGLFVLDDAAQGFGGTYKGKKIGGIGLAAATSFFPAKPLGCYGDGGAVFTNDDQLAELMRGLRVHGQLPGKPEFSHIGITGRLDTIQAAVLLEKLKIFPAEIEARNKAAARYSEKLGQYAIVPRVPEGYTSVWAQYTIRLQPGRRDGLAAALKAEGIPTAIYYAKPPHQHEVYKKFPVAEGGLPVTEKLSHEVISLPMHAYLDEPTQDRIIDAVKRALTA
ncbi:MAG TPA: DegT/DnrJ/EryC1/StrS family aminotransferase [Xanthobacteraceae bacterium]|nr:DegT/DnrJ/EryC1/StrS family aminotransferase [Xanthobacteraceae bacterium]